MSGNLAETALTLHLAVNITAQRSNGVVLQALLTLEGLDLPSSADGS
jgi:hypothetical protein